MAEGGWTSFSTHAIGSSVGRFAGIFLLRKQGTRCFVGRSDGNMREQLLTYAGSQYSEYRVFYLPSAQEAYEYECRLWHELGGEHGALENPEHPVATPEMNWWCPVCEKSTLLRALLTGDDIEPLLIPLGLATRSPAVH